MSDATRAVSRRVDDKQLDRLRREAARNELVGAVARLGRLGDPTERQGAAQRDVVREAAEIHAALVRLLRELGIEVHPR